jgi:CubicO group peptidase (beta-lactamase class C family)
VQHHGQIVHERYGTQPDTLFGPGGPVDADTTLISWSMAKSITHALVGIAAGDGLLDVDAPAPVPEWIGTDKEAIGLLDLLEMRDGLDYVEDYVDAGVSNCLEMLYGEGKEDMAAYAAARPLAHPPGSVWNYSSGTTNIVSRIVGQAVAPGTTGEAARVAMEQFIFERLFGPLGMTSAIPKFDDAGTFVGSSYVYATARDFVKFGDLYLRDGLTADEDAARILPAGWSDHARTYSASDDTGFDYGRHWWLWPDVDGVFAAHGYEGQYTIVAPDRDLVVVHLGKSPIDQRPALIERLREIIGSFEPA